VRRFAQPEVLKSAAIAALGTALACYLRLSFWVHRPHPIWFLEAVIFLGSVILWGFVFAWHTPYTHCPVFTLKAEPASYAAATLAGLLMATVLRLFLDPALRLRAPEEFPASLEQWVGMTLFNLAFNQLFLLFAPLAWCARVFHRRWIAIVLTVLFGALVMVFRTLSGPTPMPASLLLVLVFVRIIAGLMAVWFYLRGGVLLVWWWGFLLQIRHLPDL
jgi:hypothetical protein